MAKGLKDFPPVVQVAIFVLLALIPAVLLYYFVDLPKADELKKLDAQNADLKAKIAQLQAFEAKLAQYKNEYEQLQKELETLRALLPEEQLTDQFMKTAFADANAEDVHIRTFNPNPIVKKDFYTEMSFAVRVDGTYWSLVNFFRKLANEPRIVSVTTIELGGPTGGGMGSYVVLPNETVGATTVITTYFSPPGAFGTTPGQAPPKVPGR